MSLLRQYKVYKLLNKKPSNLTEEGFYFIDDLLYNMNEYAPTNPTICYYHVNKVFYIKRYQLEFTVRDGKFIDTIIKKYLIPKDKDLWEFLTYVLEKKFKIKGAYVIFDFTDDLINSEIIAKKFYNF